MKCRENKKLRYWVKNQRKIYRQFLRDEHTPLTPELKLSIENIWFLWTIENGGAGKGPILYIHGYSTCGHSTSEHIMLEVRTYSGSGLTPSRPPT